MEDFIKLPPEQYTRTNFSFKEDYINQTATLLSISKGISMAEAIPRVKKYLQTKQDIKTPMVKQYIRDRTTRDRTIIVKEWDEYISDVVVNKEQISPSMTSYINKEEEVAVLADMVDDGMRMRKVYLAEKFKAKTNNDEMGEDFNQVMQVAEKTSNNSVTGIMGSEGTILNNRSGHAALTSTVRIGTSSTNAMIERMLISNRRYGNATIVLADIASILNTLDMASFEKMVQRYNLTIPSKEHILNLILDSSKGYIPEQPIIEGTRDILNKMTGIERAAYCYCGDLNQLRLHNDALVRDIFTQLLRKYDPAPVTDVHEKLAAVPDDILNILHHMYVDELKGKGTIYSDMEKSLCSRLWLSAKNILNILPVYQDLFRTLLAVVSVSPDVAEIKTMVRRVIPASDTDSALYTVEGWIKWYRGDKPLYGSTAVAIAGLVGYLVVQSTDHILRQLSINMGVKIDDIDVLRMKSEYTFSFFGVMSNAKHYFGTPIIIERNVLKKPYIDTKGVNLKNSNTPEMVRAAATRIEQYIIDCTMHNIKPSAYRVLLDIRNVEQEILNSLAAGKHEHLRFNTIKASSAYKDEDPTRNPSQWAVFWNTIFGKELNHVATPPYKVLKVPTLLNNKTALGKWVASIKNETTRHALMRWLKDHRKTMLKTIYVPIDYANADGVPAEIMSVIDSDKVVLDVGNMLYLVLETLAVYPRERVLLSNEYPDGYLEAIVKEQNDVEENT